MNYSSLRTRPNKIAPKSKSEKFVKSLVSHCPILLKFGILVHYVFPKEAEWLKSISGEIQDGIRSPSWHYDILSFWALVLLLLLLSSSSLLSLLLFDSCPFLTLDGPTLISQTAETERRFHQKNSLVRGRTHSSHFARPFFDILQRGWNIQVLV